MKVEFYKKNKLLLFLIFSLILTTIIELDGKEFREISGFFFIKDYFVSLIIIFSIPVINNYLKKLYDKEKVTLTIIIIVNILVIFLINYFSVKTNEILIYRERGIDYNYSIIEIIFSIFQYNFSIFGGFIIYYISYLIDNLINQKKTKTNRFIVYYQDKIFPIKTKDICGFYFDNTVTYLVTNKGERYRTKSNLKEVNEKLDSKDFFQINRQTILSKESVKSISPHMNRKLRVQTSVDFETDLIVPKSKTSEFLKWMEF